MFKFLKDKLKGAISKFSKNVEEEATEQVEEVVEEKQEIVKEQSQEVTEEKQEERPQQISEEKKVEPGEKESEEEPPIPAPEPEADKTKEPTLPKETGIKQETVVEEKESAEPAIEIKEEKTIEPETPEVIEESKEIKKEISIPEPTVQEEKAIEKTEIKEESIKEIPAPVVEKQPEPELSEPVKEEVTAEPEKKGFFSKLTEKITTTKINKEKFEKLFSDLEMILLENNVALEVIDKIKGDLQGQIVNNPIKRSQVEATIVSSLKDSIGSLFDVGLIDVQEAIKNKKEKPYTIAFVGINGSGKTTSIAKIAHLLKEQDFSVVLAAGDTFRAASIEQISIHADKIGVKVIKHDYGADPAAVAFDAIKHAQSKNADVVLIDTAGRLHSNTNLMAELKKIARVAKPDLTLFVGESIAGNDCIEQAKSFNEAVGIDGIVLTKADVDEKGGAAISVSYVTQKPIVYLGMGQEYDKLEKFDPKLVLENLGF